MATKQKSTDSVVLDFSGVKPFEPMDSTKRYKFRVTKFDLGTSKENNPKVSAELTVLSPEEVAVENWDIENKKILGQDPKKTTRAAGRKLFREFSLMPEALPFLYAFIKAVDPSAKLDESFELKVKEYLGLEAECSIQNSVYNEQVRAQPQRFYPSAA